MLPEVIALATVIYLFIGIILFGTRKPGYNHVRDTISELGEVGAPDQGRVGFGLFLPVGLSLALIAALVPGSSAAAALLAGCLAAGYIVAAFFPCDPGSPAQGSARQGIHNLGGAVEYLGGAAALFGLSDRLGDAFAGLAALVLAGTVVISVLPSHGSVRGLVQRIVEIGLFGGLIGALLV